MTKIYRARTSHKSGTAQVCAECNKTVDSVDSATEKCWICFNNGEPSSSQTDGVE